MNTRTVDPRTLFAVLAMEAGLALPAISQPSQGDRLPGLAGPLLLVLLLPLGYVGVRVIRELRDPSWRLLAGIGAALLTRLVVSSVPEPGLAGLAIWFGRSVIPAAIGVGLWWRGGALCVAELTAAEVRTEFSVLGVCLLGMLAFVRPFLLPDPLLLGGAVGLFAVGGLLATAYARQDAADAASAGSARALSATTALLPVGAAVVLVAILRPSVLDAMWLLLARLIELALTPIGLLLAWLASLLPRGGQVEAPPPPVRPSTDFAPDPAALAALQDRMEWVVWVVIVVLLLVTTVATLLVVRLLLATWIGPPTSRVEQEPVELTVERSGTPRGDAQAFLGWLLRWLRGRLGGRRRTAHLGGSAAQGVAALDAWAAYQRLLVWADQQGIRRRPAETTGQLQARLVGQAPEAADAVDLVTRTYEWERYGELHPPADRLRRIRAALATLVDR